MSGRAEPSPQCFGEFTSVCARRTTPVFSARAVATCSSASIEAAVLSAPRSPLTNSAPRTSRGWPRSRRPPRPLLVPLAKGAAELRPRVRRADATGLRGAGRFRVRLAPRALEPPGGRVAVDWRDWRRGLGDRQRLSPGFVPLVLGVRSPSRTAPARPPQITLLLHSPRPSHFVRRKGDPARAKTTDQPLSNPIARRRSGRRAVVARRRRWDDPFHVADAHPTGALPFFSYVPQRPIRFARRLPVP